GDKELVIVGECGGETFCEGGGEGGRGCFVSKAGCPTTRRSTSGYCVFFRNNLLSLPSKHQPTLSRSSAEYRGVANAVAETRWLRFFWGEDQEDQASLARYAKHIEIDIHFVRDLVAAGQVRVLHVPSCYQLADIFIKGLPYALFEEFHTSLSVRCPPAQTKNVTMAAAAAEPCAKVKTGKMGLEQPHEQFHKIRITHSSKNRFTRTGSQEQVHKNRFTRTGSQEQVHKNRVNIQEFCEEYHEDILPIIMDKVRRDRRKDVILGWILGKVPEKEQEKIPTTQAVRSTDLAKLTRQERPNPDPGGRISGTILGVEAVPMGWTLQMKIVQRIENASVALEKHMMTLSPTPIVTETDIAIRRGEGIMSPHYLVCQKVTPVTGGTGGRGAARVWFDELPPVSIDIYKDLKPAFLAYFMQQKKYVKDPVDIHNIKQKDGETIEDFMERFKAETRSMKRAPECMRISGFMHGVNNPELTKRLNEHVPKKMEEMMIATTAFIRGEAAAASKKKGHTSWKAHDQSKRQTSDKRSDFRGHSREGRGSNRFTPLTRTPKEILAAEAGKFQPPLPMVTPVEKKSSSKFCDFHSDKGHITDECMQLKKQIEELVRAGKLSHLIKEIKHGRDHETIWPLGQFRLLVVIGDANYSTRAWMNFMIVRSLLPYNVEGGIVTIRSTILIPSECTSVITSSAVSTKERTCPDNFKVALHPDFHDQEVAIGGMLSDKGRTNLCSLLKKNLDIFAWQPSDMTGVPRSVAEHRLNIREGYSPVRQKKRGQAPERAKPIQAEDCYPLPKIDRKVESLCGYPFKCFLDAYKGYHQIQLAKQDEEKTAFHTGQGVYCYTKMPFGLKNASATYQRLMNKAFDNQIGRNIKVYVDDLVVKS
nr:reverse transcriptase domain-containing protein [Tanacetum cinerariifolium]